MKYVLAILILIISVSAYAAESEHPMCVSTESGKFGCKSSDHVIVTFTSEDGHKCSVTVDRIGANTETICLNSDGSNPKKFRGTEYKAAH